MKRQKGIELPINTLVVVAIAVIILLAVAAFFMGVWTPSAGGMQALAAKNRACGQLMNIGCNDATESDMRSINFDFDYDNSGTTADDNLYGYCKYSYPSLSGGELLKSCKKMCGCPGYSGIGTSSGINTGGGSAGGSGSGGSGTGSGGSSGSGSGSGTGGGVSGINLPNPMQGGR